MRQNSIKAILLGKFKAHHNLRESALSHNAALVFQVCEHKAIADTTAQKEGRSPAVPAPAFHTHEKLSNNDVLSLHKDQPGSSQTVRMYMYACL